MGVEALLDSKVTGMIVFLIDFLTCELLRTIGKILVLQLMTSDEFNLGIDAVHFLR